MFVLSTQIVYLCIEFSFVALQLTCFETAKVNNFN